MPVVDPDLQHPGRWLGAKAVWVVFVGGDDITLLRRSRRGKCEAFTFALQAWQEGVPERTRLEKEQKAGLPLVYAAGPSQMLLRWLETPIRNARKAAEIWPTVLDTLLPYPVEQCQAAFLPGKPAANGALRALGMALRDVDAVKIQQQCQQMGLSPDLIQPLALALPESLRQTPTLTLWRAYGEWVGTLTAKGEWQASARMGSDEQLPKGVLRFLRTHVAEGLDVMVWLSGSVQEGDSSALETALSERGISCSVGLQASDPLERVALTVLQAKEQSAQLFGEEFAGRTVVRKLRRRRRSLWARLVLLPVVAAAVVATAMWWLTQQREAVRQEIAGVYGEIMGTPVGTYSPDQEELSKRALAEKRGQLASVFGEAAGGRARDALLTVFTAAAETEVRIVSVRGDEVGYDVACDGDEEALQAFQNASSLEVKREGRPLLLRGRWVP